MGTASRQLKVMLRKNYLLKIRHPFVTAAEILLPAIVLMLLAAVRTQVDTQIHPAQSHIQKDMFVEVGKGVSPNFQQVLESLLDKREYLAFVPDTNETRMMIDVVSIKFPILKHVSIVYNDELELETYIRSDAYGTCNDVRNCSNPKIKGAVVFHEQGPQSFDYSIRLNHTWAFSGFPDVTTIMDTNGPFLNDLELGVSAVPTMQYSLSGFLTLQQMVDSFIIIIAQQHELNLSAETVNLPLLGFHDTDFSRKVPWTQFNPTNIRIAPFPTREYTDDQFQAIVKEVMGILYLLGFLYPVSRLISYSVFEKEQKIKEGLYMMGLNDSIFHLSWFVTYAFQFAISSAVITACTMDNIFKYSDKTLVFAYFFIFGLSAIMLSFFISTFFKRAKTAVAVGTLSFLGTFLPYYSVNDEGVSMILKVLASLLSPTAFALGSINFADYERAHVGLRWSNIWRESSGVNFSACLLMMILDTLLYCAIGLYFDKVLPREYGLRYPWNFIFKKDLWRKRSSSSKIKFTGKSSESEGNLLGRGIFNPALEAISLDMKQQELDGRCIQIRNLHKVYATKKGDCCAVNSLQLTLYENQILALLGHNGAGKSTTISMLVGLLPPTSGDALIFGKNIVSDIDEIRKVLGVCPQHDILFPELTVREHLELFAILKGVDEDTLESVVINMADEVGLADKINTVVRSLSGGMKRKLSLGIALIGNSKVIILDEPTSGMDPYSMRLTWQLIKKIKKGRIILLTTHSMDEADELGDRIAIMANGSLKCCGSSLFLKHHYGVGYTLTLVKSAPTASIAGDIVYRYVPTATCISEVGTEISFRLPMASSSTFERMFREIESCMKKPVSSMEISGNCEKDSHGIESYGISVTTLEEVFLRVAGCDYDEDECFEENNRSLISEAVVSLPSNDRPSTKICYYKVCGNYKKILGFMSTMVGRACGLIFATVISFVNFISLQCCSCCLITTSTFWQHSKALIIKRAISARRDHKTIIFQLMIPAIFLFIGLLFLELKPHPDQISLTLSTSYFNPLLSGGGGGGPIPFNLSFPIAEEVAQNVKGGWIQRCNSSSYKFPNSEKALVDAVEAAGPALGPALLNMSEYLMSSFNESYQSRYGAIVMDDQNTDGSLGYTVLHNFSCQHAAPTFINLMNSAILRLATHNVNATIQTRNHPLPMTQSQHLQRHDLDAFSAAIIVNIAFSFIPASFAVSIVKEREVKAKHQQLISGVSVLSYWISTFIWDFVSFLFPASFAIVLFYIFGLDQFVGGVSLIPTIIMLLEYGLAIASSTYCLTFFFFDHTVAQNVVLLVHFFSGLILMVISFIMGLLPSTISANSFLKNFFRISPGFCFADGLASLALLRQGMKDKTSDGVYDWNVTGASICYLAVESFIYFLLTLGLEIYPSLKLTPFKIKKWWGKINIFPHNTSYLEPLLESSPETFVTDLNEDVDVKTERNRVLSGSIDNAIIYLRNLRKVYSEEKNHGKKVAVDSLTFSVQEGECFGFLGTNGAGKTTTLSMLCGEESPSDGTAFIFGKDICSHPKAARKYIGYCPQFDALLEFLTVKEHLELYARIKSVPDYTIDNVVMEKLVEFDLLKHANMPLHKLKGLKELELSKGPSRPSAFPILTEIAALTCLTKLCICHFNIRYLPPEIGCLTNLEYLDLSFNKMKTLPPEISSLKALISMKVANNKLVELPPALTSLSRLENLDLSNNRLTSLGSLELSSMHRLQNLSLQHNKLPSIFQIPSWICCNMEGNDGDGCKDSYSSSSVEMDVYETNLLESEETFSHGPDTISSSVLTNSSSNSRCFAAWKSSGKRWKRRHSKQHKTRQEQKARQERLNNSRKWKGVDHDQLLSKKIHRISEPENLDTLVSENCTETVSDNGSLDDNHKKIFSEEAAQNNLIDNIDNDEVIIEKQFSQEDCCTAESKDERDASSCSLDNGQSEQDGASCSDFSKCSFKTKRHSDRDLDNPKPCKSRKPIGDGSLLSSKYSKISFCGTEDHLSDGFYDAGRDRPFMPLENYEQNQCLASREVILLDRQRDEELDAILLSAQGLVSNLKQLNGLNKSGSQDEVYNLQTASLLALFVSDHFGGSDRGAIIERARKSVSGSNYSKPFVCTCSTGSSTSINAATEPVVNAIEDINLSMISEKSLDSIKKRRNSIIVPIGSVQYGVCRHRALLFKYLCDHMEPPVPCELVRGYLDFSPHAWNIILIKRSDTWVRMLVDACRPYDIREEKDTEYFCRYIPLRRTQIPLSTSILPSPDNSFPSLSNCDELEKKALTTLVRCKYGSVEAAVKVRTLEVQENSADKIKNFEYNSLGEIRILGAFKHPCIVEIYGHQISCIWTISADGNPKHRVLRSAIFMEYVKGGSLRTYLEKLSEAGEKHVPVELALYIAKDVSCALLELHSKHIIHRDIKSENILFDCDRKRDDGTPTVKLCDFDSAVPLRSPLHACCIAHVGTPPPSLCVGTPRWMAPEVMRTMYKKNNYGLEADIWSFGCLLLEMLTLQIPYFGVPDSHVHDSLQMGKRPQLTDELEALSSMNEPTMIQSGEELEKSDAETDTLKFLVDLFHRCVEENPNERLTAEEIHEMLLGHTSRIQVQNVSEI